VDLHVGNLFIANFNSFSGFDTDDCSAYHTMRNNVQLYGHFLKSDFSGHDVAFENGLSIFGAGSDQYQALVPGYFNCEYGASAEPRAPNRAPTKGTPRTAPLTTTDMDRCTLLATSEEAVVSHVCPNASDFVKISNSRVFTPAGNATICGVTLPEWQRRVPGVLPNVTAVSLPAAALTAEDIVNLARATLAG
jgi:hypothetical protein